MPNQILNQTKHSREEQELPSVDEGTEMGKSQFVWGETVRFSVCKCLWEAKW